MIGKTLVHYEITAEIGRGGMGEVYQAKDTKLGRDVAIKVLPEEFALDTDRVARLQREAKLLASLNHPNIAAIYGLEESEGIHFLVMELIEGLTLKDRIKSGPIPVEEALKLALQMAEALEAAHENGVIHRDLKPANIKVTPDGKVKILDFGLAKAYVGDQENLSPMDSPTISVAATQQGVILGTAAYMSPEQARGEPVDKKADIWAFGVVLFEMLTGRQVFTGRTVSDTLASVLAREPEWNALPPNLHSRIRFLLERCLKKEPKDRYSGISDARVEIQEVLDDPSGVFAQPATAVKPQRLRLLFPWTAAALILGLIIAGVAVWIIKPPPLPEPKQPIRFDNKLPKEHEFISESAPIILAVSPDGCHFVYSTTKGLYLRSINEFYARHIAGTDENSINPFFSPDGKWIGYLSLTDQKLKKIALRGEAAVTLCEETSLTGGFSWSSDNRILHAGGGQIMWTSNDGGEWETLIEEKNARLCSPQMLPGGEAVIFVNTYREPYKIMVHSLKSGKSKELREGYSAKYIKTGHILFGAEDNLYAIPFDIDTLEFTGGRIPVVKGVSSSEYYYNYDISDSGTLVYIPPRAFDQPIFVWVDREGKEEPLAATPKAYGDLRISPDSKRVATSYKDNGNKDIWIWDLAGENLTRTTDFEGDDSNPVWTPDSKQIIYYSIREGGIGIYRRAANSTGDIETLLFEEGHMFMPWSLSPDGKILLITDVSEGLLDADIGMVSLEGDRTKVMLLEDKYLATQPQISPNGQWMAYTSNETGKDEVYVCAFPSVNELRKQVSTNGGYSPLWSPDGKELYYRNGDTVIALPIKSGTGLEFEKPIILFEGSYKNMSLWTVHNRLWDINRDDNRFLMLKNTAPESENTSEIKIVLNWFEELKERVPVD